MINLVLGTLISMGATAFYLAAHDNPDSVELSALWHPHPFWKFLGTSILLALAVAIGFVLADRARHHLRADVHVRDLYRHRSRAGPIDAMKESNRITHGHKWSLLGFVLLLLLINCSELLALVVGLLVTIPVSSLAFAHAYRILGGRSAAAGRCGLAA